MALEQTAITSLLKDQLIPDWQKEHEKLCWLDRWYRWDPEDVRIPRGATPEMKALLQLSKVPWLGLVITSIAQCLFVDGYRSINDPVIDPDDVVKPPLMPGEAPKKITASKPKPPEGPWRIWLANQMDRQQAGIHRAALAYGYSYATVLPGKDFTGEKMPVITGISPRKMWAAYENPATDDWPEYAMQVLRKTDTGMRVRLFDNTHVYTVRVNSGPSQPGESTVIIEKSEQHGAGVCPVVRYCNELDLDGRTPGEIEPHIPLAARINKTSYDRMLAQHYNSWKVRWIAGMAEPDLEEDAVRKKLKLAQDDFLVAEDADTKFGSLPETTLGGFVSAHEADVEALAAVTQTPTHELTGKMINLSAEALAAARASQAQKVAEKQISLGSSHTQGLRLASSYLGDEASAKDITGRVTWQDTTIRSLAQAVDAYGKAATMLHIPDQALWGRIPGVTKADVAEWIEMAKLIDPMEQQLNMMMKQAAPAPGQNGAAPKPAANGAKPSGGVPGNDPSSRKPAGSRG